MGKCKCTKIIIGCVLILLGIVAVGVVGYDYMQLKNSRYSWSWDTEEIFQVIVGFISMVAGVFLLCCNSSTKDK